MTEESRRKWLVIAIAGVTCGGKGSLTTKLKQEYPMAVVYGQDDFFLAVDDPRHVYLEELNHANWDIITSLDMEGMYNKVLQKLSQEPESTPGIMVLDGHLVLNYRPLLELCDLKYYFTLTKDQCWQRRKVREYNPPDPPGYFDKCVWPMYLKYKQEIDGIHNIVQLDGSRRIEDALTIVISDIRRQLEGWPK